MVSDGGASEDNRKRQERGSVMIERPLFAWPNGHHSLTDVYLLGKEGKAGRNKNKRNGSDTRADCACLLREKEEGEGNQCYCASAVNKANKLRQLQATEINN